jgi:hypothetical protein
MEATYFDGENFEEVRELASNQQRMYIETLIQNASIDEDHKQLIELNYLLFSPEEAEQTINYLQNNQLHPIFDNARPSATDIINTIKNQIK